MDYDKYLFFLSLLHKNKTYSYREIEREGISRNKNRTRAKNIDYGTVVRYCARAKLDGKVTVRRYGRKMGVRLV